MEQIITFLTTEIYAQITPERLPALGFAAAALLFALLAGGGTRLYLRRLPAEPATWLLRWTRRLSPLIAPTIMVLLLAVGYTVALRKGVDTGLAPVLTALSLSWFLVAAIYAVTHSAGKTFFSALLIVVYDVLQLFDLSGDVVNFLSGLSFEVGTVTLSAWLLLRFIVTVVLLVWVVRAVLRGIDYSLERMRHLRVNTRQLLSTLSHVAVYTAALLFALGTLGIDLTALAIFGGALGVGLGFGLQKIASNFISGMILLLERSVEVGDMIEIPVANITGIVKFTGARYTLIETFDKREVMIPNEDFITQRVVSWTFSNPRGQLRIPVTVAYGSDPERVRQLLLEAAAEHPRCLKEPRPHCLLEAFADIGIQFSLHLWIADIRERRMATQSEIMFAIWRKFEENGIGIPHQARQTTQNRPAESGESAA